MGMPRHSKSGGAPNEDKYGRARPRAVKSLLQGQKQFLEEADKAREEYNMSPSASEEAGVTPDQTAQDRSESDRAAADNSVREAEQALEAAKAERANHDDPSATTTVGSETEGETVTDADTPGELSGEAGQGEEYEAPTIKQLADCANYLRESDIEGADNVATYLDKYTEQRIAEGAETAGEPVAPDNVG